MNKFIDRLKYLMERDEIKSQYALAKQVGIDARVINNWFTGEAKKPSDENIKKLAAFFNVHPAWLEHGEKEYAPLPGKPTVNIPVLAKCPAGFPEIVSEDIVEYISLPDIPKNSYAIKVKGDSMSPNIKDGDYAIFIPATEARGGDVIIACNEFNEPLIKRYRIKDGKPYLYSDNPEYSPVKINERYRLIGKVVDIWSRRKP